MPQTSVRFPLRVLVLCAAIGGCELIVEPSSSVQDSELEFVRVAADAPPLSATSVSFWAVRGQERTAQLTYELSPIYGTNGKCLVFRVPADALLRHPDGRLVADGDSVLITIELVDPTRFQFRFHPSGLQFNPARPADLEVRYRWADPDYNRDGVVDDADTREAQRIRFWHQAVLGGRWKPIPTNLTADGFDARAEVLRFSQYALALD